MRLSKENFSSPVKLISAAIVSGVLVTCGGHKEESRPNVPENTIINSFTCEDSQVREISEEVFLSPGQMYFIDGLLITPSPGKINVKDIKIESDGISFASADPGGEVGVKVESDDTGQIIIFKAAPDTKDNTNGMRLSIDLDCGQ